jgi:D-tyrosyl-tRNA(Tyr) deacylase
MRAVLQRVNRAEVWVGQTCVGRIEAGLLVYVGFETGDGPAELDFLCDKVVNLRIFPDDEGRMNRSLLETGGAVLSISQFTLPSRIKNGRRPDFGRALEPHAARVLYLEFNERLRRQVPLSCGEFGAHMRVVSENDGPVTFILEREPTQVCVDGS